MFVIGEFARLGRVSVRMLRHYDAIGLLHPERVDDATGYRYYRAAQLARLNRIIALKELGLTLQQVQDILDKDLDVAELYGMLRLRRLELEDGIAADRDRLARVEARLSIIEREGLMPVTDVVIKTIPSVRVAELTGVAEGFEPTSITPVIQGLFDRLVGQFDADGVTPVGPAIGYYEHVDEGVLVHAAMPVSVAETRPAADDAYAVVDLPSIEAATLIHHGSMNIADVVHQDLARWIDDNGYRLEGPEREVTLEWTPNEDGWVTEFQYPVARS